MRKRLSLLMAMVMGTVLLAGCAAQETDLVSKEPFPEFSETDTNGNAVTSDIFADYDATHRQLLEQWLRHLHCRDAGAGRAVQEFKEQNINLIGVGADSGESEEQLATARKILEEKGVTYLNISPDSDNDFYKDFISEITGYPTTYIVDRDGNIIGAPIIGNVKDQMDTLQNRLDTIKEE